MSFGMPARIVIEDGIAIQGVRFVGALNKIISMIELTHIVVLFDSGKHNDRKDIVEEYKANRIDYTDVPEEENFLSTTICV